MTLLGGAATLNGLLLLAACWATLDRAWRKRDRAGIVFALVLLFGYVALVIYLIVMGL